MRTSPEETLEHVARLAILLKVVSHFLTTYFSDIGIHSLVTSYKHEARKEALFAFYIGQGIPLPPYRGAFRPRLKFCHLWWTEYQRNLF